MAFRPSLTVFLACALMLASARAESWGVVRVGGTCVPPGASLPNVLRVLKAELAPKLVTALDASADVSTADVVVTLDYCTETPSGARINVWRDGAWLQRTIELTGATPETRDRALALLIAETLNAPPAAVPVAPVAPPRPQLPPNLPPERNEPPEVASSSGGSTLPIAIRGAAIGRFTPRTSTLLGGLDLGISWRRLGLGAIALGTRRSVSIGTVTLAALAGEVSYDVLDLTTNVRIRSSAELGVAVASGSPDQVATGRVVTTPHVALTAGVASLVPVGPRWQLEAFVGGGYASSFTARVDGGDTLTLDGWFLTALLGPRFQ